MRNYSGRFLKAFLTLIFLAFGADFAFTQESLEQVYAEIDKVFSEHSSENLSKVLGKYNKSSDYNLYESYTLKKTRQLIIENDLAFARQVSLVVIDNNLENFDAVDLYSYIDRAILGEEMARKAEENRLKLEEERLSAMTARAKSKIEKSNSYSSVSTASGSQVYMNQDQQSFSTVNWDVQLGIADVMFQNITAPQAYTSLKYGLAVGMNLFYKTDQYVIGAESFADFHMLTLGQGEPETMSSLRFMPMIALRSLSKKMFFRGGIAVSALSSEKTEKTDSVGNFITPAVGIGFENFFIGKAVGSLHYDYYLGHFFYGDLKSAMGFGCSVLIPFNQTGNATIGLKLGIDDLLFVKEQGIDNRCKAIFAIGVGNVKD
ncbi:hypothetical protein [Treponema pectinovorum]|uniref:hypothetical protein n=1 Tax=Treponema pectinovorum TaxID=164 RepID=UPI0011C940F4|nr:hypothetical protein [Treponema pectinovorum]